MTGKPIDLDSQRGMAAQKATEIRRMLAEVESSEASSRTRQAELAGRLVATMASTWREAADKAGYLKKNIAASPAGPDPRRQKLINAVLDDFDRLCRKSP